MTDQEYQTFLGWSVPDYAQAHVRSGQWKASDALELARAEHTRLLPQGVATPDQYLRTILDGAGTRMGEVWFGLQPQEARPQLFVFWIGVETAYRRKGVATEVFRLIDSEAKRLGVTRISLHVFGDNLAGRALYERLGFQVTNLLMSKPVPADHRG